MIEPRRVVKGLLSGMPESITGEAFSMLNSRPRVMRCPKCGLQGYGPYLEWIHDPRHQCFRLRMQVVHRMKTSEGYKTIRTCVLELPRSKEVKLPAYIIRKNIMTPRG